MSAFDPKRTSVTSLVCDVGNSANPEHLIIVVCSGKARLPGGGLAVRAANGAYRRSWRGCNGRARENRDHTWPRHSVDVETVTCPEPGAALITVPELASEALGSFLAEDITRRFGSTGASLTEVIPLAARLALDCIGNSDALSQR